MVTVRVPLRICLAGGGTDLPAYYRQHGGDVTSATIDKYLTITVRPGERMRILEPQNRYALAAGWTDTDLVSVDGDVPPGSGLGGSGALLVGLLKTRWPELDGYELAAAAFNIERYSLGRPVGWQDATVAAIGGVVSMAIERDGRMQAHRVPGLDRLKQRLVMFATGIQRDAGSVLASQANAVQSNGGADAALQEIHRIGAAIARDLHATGGERFGELTHQHWEAKRRCCGATTTPQIDEWYQLALLHGAQGGKCIGAGAGGYMLFVVEPDRREHLVEALTAAGLTEAPFHFVGHGVEIVG